MKSNFDSHPAIVEAKKKMKIRYTAAAISLVLCLAVFALGFFLKPKTNVSKLDAFSKDTQPGTFVRSEVVLTSALFSQDAVDDNGNVTDVMYHILAVDNENNRFIITATQDYYEKELQKLEDNSVQNIETGMLEILDYENKVEVCGYSREMSNNLTEQLGKHFSDYESVLLPYSLEIVENPDEVEPLNYFYIAGGFVAVITLCILFTAVTATADYSRKKEKLEKRLAEKAKGKK